MNFMWVLWNDVAGLVVRFLGCFSLVIQIASPVSNLTLKEFGDLIVQGFESEWMDRPAVLLPLSADIQKCLSCALMQFRNSRMLPLIYPLPTQFSVLETKHAFPIHEAIKLNQQIREHEFVEITAPE